MQPPRREGLEAPVEPQAQLEHGLPQFFGDSRGQPDPRLDFKGLDEMGGIQGQDLGEPPPEEGFLGLGPTGQLGEIAHEHRRRPQILHDPAGGTLGQGGQGLGQLVLGGWPIQGPLMGSRDDPVGLQPQQGGVRRHKRGTFHG